MSWSGANHGTNKPRGREGTFERTGGQGGSDAVTITRRGKTAAQITAIKQPKKPVDAAALIALTEIMQFQQQSAGDFIRRMRDEDRY